MGDPLLLVASIGLGLSVLVSAIRLIDWFLHSDPKVIAHTGRWAAMGLAILSVPLLIGLLLTQRWTAAIALAAVMLLAFACYGPRLLRSFFPQRLVPDWSPPKGAQSATSYDFDAADPKLVQRSIAVLEEYLRRSTGIAKSNGADAKAIRSQSSEAGLAHNGNGHDRADAPGPMSEAEALDILGLGPDAAEDQINEAHRRLAQLVHPDRGGSHYLAVKINQAKGALLDAVTARARLGQPIPPKKSSRRRSPRPPP
jgi:hypothetical protein